MPMNRRSFLQALGLVGAASVALSPMLDLAPIVTAPSASALPAIVIPKRVIYASIQISPELIADSALRRQPLSELIAAHRAWERDVMFSDGAAK